MLKYKYKIQEIIGGLQMKTRRNHDKKILYSILIIDFIIMILNIVELIHEGFFRDIYSTVKIRDDVTCFFWISLLLTIFVFVITLVFLFKMDRHQIRPVRKAIGILSFLLLIIANIYYGISYHTIVKPYRFDEITNQDYIASEYFRGISFDELQQDINSDSKIMIYIGREACSQCKEFEEVFELILMEKLDEIKNYL